MDRPDECLDPDDLAALLHERLAPASQLVMEKHIAACGECRTLVSIFAQVESRLRFANLDAPGTSRDDLSLASTAPNGDLHPELAPGTLVGRYVVTMRLGAGAMGVVYAAHDPELDRKVAVKVLNRAQFAGGEGALVPDRLRREAQALAQLTHPNVVAVHDVGTIDDCIFIAMELVEGRTLAGWLAGGRRSWREVVAMFVLAGQGLAAAHNAGLVHRDFKPDNVLVGHDGRVRVADFGFARMLGPEESTYEHQPSGSGIAARSSSARGLVGTPYYMAPEQFLGQPSDARTDQFSFCVALYAALAGQHPFAEDHIDHLPDAVVLGRLRRPPDRSVLPRRLLRLLARGMAVDPVDRYPDMNALLAELGDDPTRRRTRVAVAAMAALAVTGVVVFVTQRNDETLLCKGAERKWTGVWDASRAGAVEQAFAATAKPFARAAYLTVHQTLDGYRARWTTMHTEACEATRLRGEQSEDLLQRRMLCLDASLREADALVERFSAADAAIVEYAPAEVRSLRDLDVCADIQALSNQVSPPVDRATRVRVGTVRSELARLRALRIAGRAREARERVGALVAAATATRYRPVEAETLRERGDIELMAGNLEAAAGAYEQAVWHAEAGRADELAATSWIGLMTVRRSQARYEEALALSPRVTAALERFGNSDEIEGELHIALAATLSAIDRIADARAEAEKARTILERHFGAVDLHVADALEELGKVAVLSGNLDAALEYRRQGSSIKRRLFGEDHPEVANALVRVAEVQTARTRYEDSLVILREAQAIYERTIDADHLAFAMLAHDIGWNYQALGQFDKAVEMHRRAVAVAAIAYGRDHPTYAWFLRSLGYALAGLERFDESQSNLGAALAVLEKRLGPDHDQIAACLRSIAEVLYEQARYSEARAVIIRALAMYEKIFGPHSAYLRPTLLVLGRIELHLGAPERAIAPLERAYALGPDTDPGIYAEIQSALGRALVDAHRDEERGMKLAQAAQQEFEQDGRETDELQDLMTWRRRRIAPRGSRK